VVPSYVLWFLFSFQGTCFHLFSLHSLCLHFMVPFFLLWFLFILWFLLMFYGSCFHFEVPVFICFHFIVCVYILRFLFSVYGSFLCFMVPVFLLWSPFLSYGPCFHSYFSLHAVASEELRIDNCGLYKEWGFLTS
jgi:hypothetical protein